MNAVSVPASVLFVIAVFASPLQAASRIFPDFTQLVDKHATAVVNISSTQRFERRPESRAFDDPHAPQAQPFNDFFEHYFDDSAPRLFESPSLGSGFLISADGYVLTCAHVVDGASEIVVRLRDRREFNAQLIGLDRRSDIALLKIEAAGLPRVEVGDPSKLGVGEWVLAIGSPFGFDSSATAGIVSATGRSLPKENYVPFIQTDVAINPGNSGGPLFNLDGEVVGVNSMIYSRTGGFMGLSFAIPIDVAMRIAEQLKQRGTIVRGWLGVSLQEVSRNLAGAYGLEQPRGALVADVLPEGPAAKSDLRSGDLVLTYQGEPISHLSDLPSLVSITSPGTRATLEVLRYGQGRRTVIVTIGALKEAPDPPKSARVSTEDRLGLVLRDLSEAQRQRFDLADGAYVANMGAGIAWEAGLRTGDVIVEVNGKPVRGAVGFERLMAHVQRGKPVVLRIRRGGAAKYIALQKAS